MNSFKIIVIEDEKNIRNNIKEILELEGYEVHDFSNPIEALQNINAFLYNLFICDIVMAEMSGIELFYKIREMADYETTPFVFVSAKPLKEISSILNLPDTYYIGKPFSLLELTELINHVLNGKPHEL